MNGWLLDTNVISEWRKPRPDPGVTEFVAGLPRPRAFTSIVCFAELRRGAQLSKQPELRQLLDTWIEETLRPYFKGQILELTEDIVILALGLMDRGGKSRNGMSQVDAWIAATALHHNLTVMTRNARDIVPTGAPVLDPWTGERCNGA